MIRMRYVLDMRILVLGRNVFRGTRSATNASQELQPMASIDHVYPTTEKEYPNDQEFFGHAGRVSFYGSLLRDHDVPSFLRAALRLKLSQCTKLIMGRSSENKEHNGFNKPR